MGTRWTAESRRVSKVKAAAPETFLEDAFNLVLRISIRRGFVAPSQTTHFSAV